MAHFHSPVKSIHDFSKPKENMVITRVRMVPNGRTISTGLNVKQ